MMYVLIFNIHVTLKKANEKQEYKGLFISITLDNILFYNNIELLIKFKIKNDSVVKQIAIQIVNEI